MNAPKPALIFISQDEWESWLETHGESSSGIWLRLAKKSSGLASLTYAQALEGALCFGWIDGQKRADNDQFWLQRFSPRAARSIWSSINTQKAQALIEAGRMRATGLREIQSAQLDGRWEKAYVSARKATVPPDLQVALDANEKAKAFFESLNSQNRYAILFRIQTAKKPETRAKKIAHFVQMLATGEKLHQ